MNRQRFAFCFTQWERALTRKFLLHECDLSGRSSSACTELFCKEKFSLGRRWHTELFTIDDFRKFQHNGSVFNCCAFVSFFLQMSCTGILHWKHYTKRSSSTFTTWTVDFNKTRNNTSLHVSYTGMMGVYQYQNSQWACMRLSILFNSTDCTSPAPIHSGAVFRQDYSNFHSHSLSPSIISGECRNLKSGPLKITVKVEQKCYTYSAGIYNGEKVGFSDPVTYALRVEERCQSNQK